MSERDTTTRILTDMLRRLNDTLAIFFDKLASPIVLKY